MPVQGRGFLIWPGPRIDWPLPVIYGLATILMPPAKKILAGQSNLAPN